MVEPIHVDDRENRVESWIYEIPELHSVLDWDVPIRGFKIIEKPYKILSKEKVYIKEETFLCMTTLPAELADADIVRQIVHAKWGVENNAIKDLKDNWYMEHNFHHHPNATYALLLILFMAHNLFYAYVFRHMKSYRLYQPTMKRITEDFTSSFLHWNFIPRSRRPDSGACHGYILMIRNCCGGMLWWWNGVAQAMGNAHTETGSFIQG